MRILITGGAGFIGSNIQDAYLKAGHQVCVVDNLTSGRRENINSKTHFVQIDICDPELKKVFQEFRPEIVSHHAAQMDVRKSMADPFFDAQVNVTGLINVLEAARSVNTQKIIFASTGGAVYGEQEVFPADENHPIRPASPYGLSKHVGELYLELYERAFGLKFVVLRYANVYGPRQNPHGEAGVVAIFAQKLVAKQTPKINGDGGQTRDYVYVEDVVQANLIALQPAVSGVYNIGTGIENSVTQIFETLATFCQSSQVEHGPAKEGEQRRSVIDASKARRELGWGPQVSFSDGLKKTFEWFKTMALPK